MDAAAYPYQDVDFRFVEGGFHISCPSGAGGGSSGKGGGSDERTPPDEANTLRSKSYAKALFVLCEGQIKGPSSGDILRHIYLDKTPMRAPSGRLNFSGFSVAWRNGSPGQARLPGFDKVGRPGPQAGVTLQSGVPVVRTITDPDAQGVLLRFRIPSLREISDRGNIVGSSVRYQVRVSNSAASGANPELRIDKTLQGKSTSPYDITHEIDLRGNPPWEITVNRVTPDPTGDRIFNNVIWQDITEVEYTNDSYPGTALLAIQIDSEPFGSSLPTIHVDFQWRLARVPHNYDENTQTHIGQFNGASFKTAWTTNPVWVIFDLLTDTEAGANLPDEYIDVLNFYEAALYCSETVPTTSEQRWTFNGFLEQREKAFSVVEAIADSFNASLYWSGGKISLSVDKPEAETLIYMPSDVVIEKDEETGQELQRPFRYSRAPITNRPNLAIVAFADPDNFYELDSSAHEAMREVEERGLVPVDLTKYGCTSRSEAYRFARWNIVTNQYTQKTVEFTVANEGLLIEPGRVCGIQDPTIAGRRLSGRIMEVGSDYIKIDDAIQFDVGGGSYTLRTIGATGEIQSNEIDLNRSGSVDVLQVFVTTSFAAAPLLNTPWSINIPNLIAAPYKITNIIENEDGTYAVNAIEYIDKYPTIEQNLPFQPFTVSLLPNPYAPPPAPTNVEIEESFHVTTNSSGVKLRCDITWGYPDTTGISIDRFVIEYRTDADSAWQYGGDGFVRSLTLFDLEPGNYTFRITPISSLQIKGTPAIAEKRLLGLLAPPSDIQNFRFEFFNQLLLFRWDKIPDLDVIIGGSIVIRHTPSLNVDVTSFATWGNSSPFTPYPGSATEATLPGIDGTYLIKAYDGSDKQSVTAAAIEFVGAEILTQNVILTLDQHSLWQGVRERIEYDAANGWIQIGPGPVNLADAIGSPSSWTITPVSTTTPTIDPDTGETTTSLEVEVRDSNGNQVSGANVEFNIQSGLGDLTATATPTTLLPSTKEGVYYFFENPVDLGSEQAVTIRSVIETTAFSETQFWSQITEIWSGITTLWSQYGVDEPIDDAIVILQVRTRPADHPTSGPYPWTDWVEFKVGEFVAQFFEFRLLLQSGTISHNVSCRQCTIVIDIPDLVQDGVISTLATGDGYVRANYQKPFYLAPTLTVGITNPATGEIYQTQNEDRFGFDVRVVEPGSAPVARQVSYIARKY